MEIILLEKIANLGSLGDVVNVRSGYARNFLVPQKKAKIANKQNLIEFESIRADLEKAEQSAIDAATSRKDKFKDIVLELTANAGQGGKLFGSISNIDIANELTERGHEVERREVRMNEGPLRSIGEHFVTIHLHTDVEFDIKVIVKSIDGEADVTMAEEEAEEVEEYLSDADNSYETEEISKDSSAA